MKVFGETEETSVAETIARLTKRLREETKKRRGLFGRWHVREESKSEFKYDDRYGALKTEYEICCDKLGVKITDSLEEVKKRFHALALQCHPDKTKKTCQMVQSHGSERRMSILLRTIRIREIVPFDMFSLLYYSVVLHYTTPSFTHSHHPSHSILPQFFILRPDSCIPTIPTIPHPAPCHHCSHSHSCSLL